MVRLKRGGILGLFRFLLISIAGWMNQEQQQAIDCLREQNRVLQEQFGGRGLRFTDDQRRRLAAKAKGLGRVFLRWCVSTSLRHSNELFNEFFF
jgi:hypothetical protein